MTVPSCEPESSARRAKLRGVGSAAKDGLGATLVEGAVEGAVDGELVATTEVGVVVCTVGACETEHAVNKRTATSLRKDF